MTERKVRKCRVNHACEGAKEIHQWGNPTGKGLQIGDSVDVNSYERFKERLSYRPETNGRVIWLNFCPWCGSDLWKFRIKKKSRKKSR